MPDFIINDSTNFDDFQSPYHARGLLLPERLPLQYGDEYTTDAPSSVLIPRSEWQARIEENQALKSTIPDLCDQVGLTVKDQQMTSYCWVNAPTHCMEIVGILQGQKKKVLSAASAGARIKHFLNVGGNGDEALSFIAKNGLNTEDEWPKNSLSPQYDTADNRQKALANVAQEWWVLPLEQIVEYLISLLLRRVPVAVGYNWWSHEVTAVEPVWLDGDIALKIDNSWGTSWKENGRGILQGKRMVPDDACCPLVKTASN